MSKAKRILSPLFLFLVITISTGETFAQALPALGSNANKPDIEEVSKISEAALIRGCALAVERIKAGEAYIVSLEKLNDTQSKTIAAQTEKISLLEQSLALKEKESQALREALALKDAALTEYKGLLDLSKKEVEREKKIGNQKGKAGFLAGLVTGFSLRFLF